MTLKELQIGKSAIVEAVGGAGALRQHFLDMGLIPGAEVTLVKLAPMGDPMELRIHGYELTLRLDDAAQIIVTPTEKTPAVHAPVDGKMVEHPGLGEGGKYHTKEGEHPLPEDFCAQGGVLAYSLPDACPHATTAHRRFVYTEPTNGGIMLEHGDTARKYTVYAIETDGRMIVGDVTV